MVLRSNILTYYIMFDVDWVNIGNELKKVCDHEYKLYAFKELYRQILIHT
jgi:hypothetical protein